MHKFHVNDLRIDLRLTPTSAFLVKSGNKGDSLTHPELPDMVAVRTRRPTADGGDEETVYIPGSSLKGVVRSAAERILRTVAEGRTDLWACDPLDQRNPCHKDAARLGDEIARHGGPADLGSHPMAVVHRKLCYACRTFGSQAMASRVRFADALPTEKTFARANKTEVRSGVSLDRRTGGPAHGRLFEQEVVPLGSFQTSIFAENVQLWQVALLAAVLDDMDLGITRLGSAKTRGLGAFKVELTSVSFRQTGTLPTPAGVATVVPSLAGPYDLVPEEPLPAVPPGAESTHRPPFHGWTWSGQDGWNFLRATQEQPWAAFVGRSRA